MDTTTTIIIIIIVVIIAFIVYMSLVIIGRHLHAYFINAAIAYIWLGDKAARIAALTTAKSASERGKLVMISYVKLIQQSAFDPNDDISVRKSRIDRINSLIQDITERDWSTYDYLESKQILKLHNVNYAKALNLIKPDPSIFVHKYPVLFSSSRIIKIIQETEVK